MKTKVENNNNNTESITRQVITETEQNHKNKKRLQNAWNFLKNILQMENDTLLLIKIDVENKEYTDVCFLEKNTLAIKKLPAVISQTILRSGMLPKDSEKDQLFHETKIIIENKFKESANLVNDILYFYIDFSNYNVGICSVIENKKILVISEQKM